MRFGLSITCTTPGAIRCDNGPEFLFESLFDARDLAEDWLRRYNHIRPHDSLGSLPPAKHREKIIAEQSNLQLST